MLLRALLLHSADRYLFVHSFEGTGGTDMSKMLSAHAWVKSHTGRTALKDGGASLTTEMTTSSELKTQRGEALLDVSQNVQWLVVIVIHDCLACIQFATNLAVATAPKAQALN